MLKNIIIQEFKDYLLLVKKYNSNRANEVTYPVIVQTEYSLRVALLPHPRFNKAIDRLHTIMTCNTET